MKIKPYLITLYAVLFVCYIFPSGFISQDDYKIAKFIFIFVIGLQYLYLIIKNGISKKEILFFILLALLILLSKNINYLLFIYLTYLWRIKDSFERMKEKLLNGKALYVCLIFTVIYSIIFSQMDNAKSRYAFTAIGEANFSGLSIFYLGCMLYKKNKKASLFTFLLGCLTFSRSYYLALICLLGYNLIKKYKIVQKVRTKLTYLNLTIISSVGLVLIAYIYFNVYYAGGIILSSDSQNRLFQLFDYSNLFRFQVVVIFWKIVISNPKYLLFGFTDKILYSKGSSIASSLNLPYRTTPIHNLFYSHFQKYGAFSIIETIIISKILEKIVNKENFGIFISVVLYSIFLGSGLYNFWLYLTVICLVCFSNDRNVSVGGV